MTAELDASGMPEWLQSLLGLSAGDLKLEFRDRSFELVDGILRDSTLTSDTQQQTSDTFGFKWQQRDTFESSTSLERVRDWLLDRYGDPVQEGWLSNSDEPPLVLDAGCGAAMSALEYWGPHLDEINYLGTDISEAVDVARSRFLEREASAGFIQADLMSLPLPENSVDVIFSEGVLHHTDSTQKAFEAICPLLKQGGLFMFYLYRLKGPVREFTDDYVRERLQRMSPEEGWEAMKPLTHLGEALGKLDVEVEVPEGVDLLGIPAGRMNLQRFFYWHFCKAFYHPDLSFEETNHINFDWYAPANAHRHTLQEIQQWCDDGNLLIERERVEDAGITIVARKY